ncbi:T9SS C-terminal target domain-containing protein [Hymenobacter sediminis]|uniref:T9SS type A sorting domain-containing protein n=1 Tax=Hymenobacter sediminis TaxID=2218621 RepID=UPI000DA6D107|nr:T9SS type A sorting domain-containing protein [Hymenobacter sediminis]RPD49754.1 T9SS C-terminal target domain-containing protein [Hymenobacter sediminis]
MKKILLPVLLACATLVAPATFTKAQAQTPCPAAPATVIAPSEITGKVTWTSDKIYQLNGNVFVRSNAELIIEPGTIIKGNDPANPTGAKGSLIVQQGGKLTANGTAAKPIVFTSGSNNDQRKAGDWGGIILLGRAPINNAGGTANVEGIPQGNGTYGGTDPNDNSGTLRYVRIEFPGIDFGNGNEINGLTMAGVGSGTTIEYIQVSYANDDSYEWFGGTVNAKYLIAFRGLDDDFDTDNGYSGKVQYAVSLRDPKVADISGSNGFESDNDATGTTNSPKTSAVFSNVSIFLPGPATGLDTNYRRGMHIRRNSAQSIFNTVISGYPTGILLDGAATEANATSGSLVLKNNVFADMASNFATVTGSTFDLAGYFNATDRSNTLTTVSALNLNADNFNLTNPKFLPQSTSPLLTGAAFTDAKLADSFFEKTGTFRGAFGTTDWTAGWANFNPKITCYNAPGLTLSNKKSDQVQQLAVVPNPSAGAATLSFELKRSGATTVQVRDLTGRQVASVINAGKLAAGSHRVALPATLKAGVYTVTVTTPETSQSVRFVVSK